MDAKAHSHLTTVHKAWEAANLEVRATERKLAEALSAYEAGTGPLPVDLQKLVLTLRTDCNEKFKALMAAMSSEARG
jgi:hypothetical protein